MAGIDEINAATPKVVAPHESAQYEHRPTNMSTHGKLANLRIIRPATALATLLCIALPGTAGAQSAQPTIESAHAFLSEVLTKGTSFFVTIDDSGSDAGHATITQVSGSGCRSSVQGRVTLQYVFDRNGRRVGSKAAGPSGKGVSRSIDWSKMSSVMRSSADTVFLQGAITLGDGSLASNLAVILESTELATRVEKAMSFLREKCDSTSKYGF